MASNFPHGTVHQTPDDLERVIRADPAMLLLWEKLTPLGRNEYICWVCDAKQPVTRGRRIQRILDDLVMGKRRPCCWAGCVHRTDKAPGQWQQAVMAEQRRKRGS